MTEGPQIRFEIDEKSLADFQRATEKQIEQAAAMTVFALAQLVGDKSLLTQYTQNSKPAKPTGSTYIRTFNLQRSSQTRLVRDTMPVEASWEAKTEYASYVIGKTDQQAAIHSGRWPNLEYTIKEVEKEAPKIFDESMRKVTK